MTDANVGITLDEAYEIARKNPNTVIVGGQALAMWADYYQVNTPAEYINAITKDLDFLGTRHDAQFTANALDGRILVPTFDDHTPNAAVLILENYHGRDVEIDYMAVLEGVDENKVRERAIIMALPRKDDTEVQIKVMHPMDVYQTRLANLYKLPEKRDAKGVAQARLAERVLEQYLLDLLNTDTKASRREAYDIAEYLGKVSVRPEGLNAYHQYNLNPLACIPVSRFPDKFQHTRFPQIQAQVLQKRNKNSNSP